MTTVCKTCGKPPLANRAGSVTSYFFQHNYCQCHSKSESINQGSRSPISPVASADLDADPVCANCGKSRPSNRRAGSFTAFLFKELRCNCAGAASKPAAKRGVVGSGPGRGAMSGSRLGYGSNSGSSSSSASGSSSSSSFGSSSSLAASADRRTKSRSRTAARVAQRRQYTEVFRKSKASVKSGSEVSAEPVFGGGTVIGGAFCIQSVIGTGGMGVVYLAEQMSLKKQVALKILAPELVNEQSWLRFKAEAKTLAALNHSALVKVYDLGVHENTIPYYAMDFLQGQSLEEILAKDGPLPLRQALTIFIEVLEGLAYAHRNGIVHRDLKPGNIMLCTVNGAQSVKILDFGISKLIGPHAARAQSLTAVGEIFGSPFYMSPEQCTGSTVDARSDIYSLGCTLIEVLTGFVPFEGEEFIETVMMHQEEPPPLLADLELGLKYPVELDFVLAKCLAKHPQDRYQSAKEMALDLGRVLDGKEIMAPRLVSVQKKQSSSSAKAGEKSFRLPLFPTLCACGVAIIVVAASAYVILRPTSAVDYSPRLRSAASVDAVVTTAALQPKDAAVSALGVAPSGSDFQAFRKIATASRNGDTALKTELAPVIVDPSRSSTEPRGSEKESSNSKVTTIDDNEHGDFAAIVDMSSKRLNAMDSAQKPSTGSQNETSKYSSLVVVKGVKIRRFNFPTDITIGRIVAGRNSEIRYATGVIDVPADAEIFLTPFEIVGRYPQYMRRFRPDEVNAVYLSSVGCNDLVLSATANIPGITELHLVDSASLTEKGFAVLSKFKKLENFSLLSSNLTGECLAQANCWQNLKRVTWRGARQPGAFLEKLQESRDLTYLDLSANKLSRSEFLLISKLTGLEHLSLANTRVTVEDLESIAVLPKVTSLDLTNCGLGYKAIPILQKMKRLKELAILQSTSLPEFGAKWINQLPHVKVRPWAETLRWP